MKCILYIFIIVHILEHHPTNKPKVARGHPCEWLVVRIWSIIWVWGLVNEAMEDERVSIYRASRTIKRRENSIYNALRSIYEDSIFVGEIAQLWPELPLLANLRCGLWYSSRFESNCYFKSTDGHTNNWSFNTSRLNLHVALIAGISLSL